MSARKGERERITRDKSVRIATVPQGMKKRKALNDKERQEKKATFMDVQIPFCTTEETGLTRASSTNSCESTPEGFERIHQSRRTSAFREARTISRRMSFTDTDNVKACVRIRPYRDIEMLPNGTFPPPCIRVDGNKVIMRNNDQFDFDQVFWSIPKSQHHKHVDTIYDQNLIFNILGSRLLEHIFRGYNACIMAYGQTGSGKTYTMMGPSESSEGVTSQTERGLIPRMCQELFDRLKEEEANLSQTESMLQKSFQIDVRFMEIYMEKVRDLLSDGKEQNKHNLKVRLHPITGPFVEGLSCHQIHSWEECLKLLHIGQASRTVAATRMNDVSSRSHAILKISVTQTTRVSGQLCTRMAALNLVDLAGSERVSKSGVTGENLAEAAKVNHSLSTLRKVIDALLQPYKAKRVIPYRESVLTWTLSDSLGGNSRTMLVATVSPHFSNKDETLSTLVYANKARRIVNSVAVNEDSTMELISDLQAALEDLRSQKESEQQQKSKDESAVQRIQELQEEIDMSEKAIAEMESQTRDLEQRYSGVICDLQTRVEEKELHTMKLAEQNDKLSANLNKEIGEKREIYNRRASLMIRYDDLSKQLKDKEEDVYLQVTGNNHRLKTLEELLDEQRRTIAERDEEITGLNNLVFERDVQIVKQSVELESLQRRVQKSESEFKFLLEERRDRISQSLIPYSNTIAIAKTPTLEEVSLGDHIQKLESQVQNIQNQLNKDRNSYQQTISGLKYELSMLEEKHSKLHGDVTESETEISKAKEEAEKHIERELNLMQQRELVRQSEVEKQLASEKGILRQELTQTTNKVVSDLDKKYREVAENLPSLLRLREHLYCAAKKSKTEFEADCSSVSPEHLKLLNIALRFENEFTSHPVPGKITSRYLIGGSPQKTSPPPKLLKPSSYTAGKSFFT